MCNLLVDKNRGQWFTYTNQTSWSSCEGTVEGILSTTWLKSKKNDAIKAKVKIKSGKKFI